MIQITIKEPPITKKNHQQIIRNPRTKRPMVIPSKEYRAYEKAAMATLPKLVIDYPVNVKAVFYMKTHRRVDLVNLQEALLDVLVKGGVLLDDNSYIVARMDGSRVDYDCVNPRTEVEIERLK